MRKMPMSAKDLYNEQIDWMEDEEECASPVRTEKRGITVTDIYKMEVLGEGQVVRAEYSCDNITSFSNSNIFKYTYKD